MESLTVVLIVDSVEESLEFWQRRLGFEIVIQVEHEGRLGFVQLQQGGAEVMLQSRASVRDDIPAIADEPNRAALFVKVADLDPIRKALADVDKVVPERRTFYGATEISVRAPGDHLVTFAQFDEPG